MRTLTPRTLLVTLALAGLPLVSMAQTAGGSIHGTKWVDADGDGERGSDEPGLAGVTIYVDINRNGVLDPDEPHMVSMRDDPATSVNESGLYWISDLPEGGYLVREVVPDGLRQTFPPTGAHEVRLEAGQRIDGVDFGNQPPQDGGNIFGTKWADANRNGERDPGEPGLPGVTIYVDVNLNGVLDDNEPRAVSLRDDPHTSVNEAGRYGLVGLPAGEYIIREVVPDGFVQTFPPGDGAHLVVLEPGRSVDGVDFGNRPPEDGGNVLGTKWADANGNGTRDAGEPGLAGVTIYSDLNFNGRLDEGEPRALSLRDDPNTTANEAGRYRLVGLPAGEHHVREVVPDGFVQTFPLHGFHAVVLEPGRSIDAVDFGNQPPTGGSSVHGRKWQDENGNAENDPNEPGLAGVTIYVDLNRNGVLDADEPRAVTMRDDPVTDFDEAGLYWLDRVEAGAHVVREVVPDGFRQTFPPSGAHEVILEPGQGADGIDFGNQPLRPASVHGTKWQDENADGARDENEPGLPGVVIYLDLNSNGQLDRGEPHALSMRDDPATDFDEAGMYWITDVEPGRALVREVVPDGFVQTFPPGGAHEVVLEPGLSVDGVDFGNHPRRPASIHGAKWHDDDGDGERDENEPGLAGVTIYSDVNLNGEPDPGEPRAVTMRDDPDTDFDETGRYWLTGLEAGRHVIHEVVPDGFEQTFPPDGAHGVALEPGQTVDGIDFGNRRIRPGSIHGLKWRDDDADGARDPDEPGLAGVTIYVDLNHNGELDVDEPRTLTMADDPATAFDESGRYWIGGLEAGAYVVREIVTRPFFQTFPDSGFHEVRLEPGQTAEGIDFGNKRPGRRRGHFR